MIEHVADCLRQVRGPRQARECLLQPGVQCLDDRAAALLANATSVLGRVAADLGLDRVEARYAGEGFGGERRFGGGVKLIKSSSTVSPTEHQLDLAAALPGQAGEPLVAVHLQLAVKGGQVLGGMLAAAVLTVDIRRGRRCRSLPWPIVDRIAPQPPGPGLAAAGLEHRQGRVVGEQHGRGHDLGHRQLVERPQPPAGPAHPGAQSRAVNPDTLACQHLRLPVQRQEVAELADHDMGHQRLGRHATVDRPLRCGRLHHASLALAAAITGAAQDLDPQLGGNQVEHLRGGLADLVQLAPAAGADLAVDVEHHLVAWQVRRQRAQIALRWLATPLLGLLGSLRLLLGRTLRCFLLEIADGQQQLVWGELLGATTEPVPQ